MKHTIEDLRPIVYALTLRDRPNNRHKWILRGFRIANARPDFLLKYWDCRLSKGEADDLDMYQQVLGEYKAFLETKALAPVTVESPSPAKMVLSAAKAVAGWVQAGVPIASDEEVARRRACCLACEHWDGLALRGTGRCKLCGCSTWAKIRLATEECPEGRWGKAV